MDNIEDLLKKFLYTGVGMVSMAKNQLEKAIEEIVEKNKLQAEEGEKIMKDFMESTENKTNEIKDTINKLIEKANSKLKLVNKAEFEELKKRVKELEKRISK